MGSGRGAPLRPPGHRNRAARPPRPAPDRRAGRRRRKGGTRAGSGALGSRCAPAGPVPARRVVCVCAVSRPGAAADPRAPGGPGGAWMAAARGGGAPVPLEGRAPGGRAGRVPRDRRCRACRAIRTGRLSASQRLHPRPIHVVVYHGPRGDPVSRGGSRLDAFSGSPVRTWPPGRAAGATTGSPEVRPSRSSRTGDGSSQVSNARGR